MSPCYWGSEKLVLAALSQSQLNFSISHSSLAIYSLWRLSVYVKCSMIASLFDEDDPYKIILVYSISSWSHACFSM